MRKSCNDLRARFLDLARSANLGKDAIGDIRVKLGLSREGTETETKKLLDRKVAAKVINMISKGVSGEMSGNVWNAVTRSDVMRSSGDMDFESVRERTAAQHDAFLHETGLSLSASIFRHCPDVAPNLTKAKVDGLVNRHLAPLCDKAKMKMDDGQTRELVHAAMVNLEPELRDLVGAEAVADGRLAKICREIETNLHAQLFGAKTDEERLAYNPTGGTVRWEDDDAASKYLLDDMVKDAAAAAHPPFSQLSSDYRRGWTYTLEGTSFRGNSTDNSALDEKSDFRKAFRSVFTDSKTGKVDEAAETFAFLVLHQGIMAGLYKNSDSKTSFFPPCGGSADGVSADDVVNNFSLSKSETKGRYVVRFTESLKGFTKLMNTRLDKLGDATAYLDGVTSENRFEVSFAFEFGIGDDGQPHCTMLENAKGEMTIPTRQDLVYESLQGQVLP